MEEYKRKYSEVSERLMERNRQYQKLQGLYDSLRLRNMVVGDKATQPQPGHQDFNSSNTIFLYSNIGTQILNRAKFTHALQKYVIMKRNKKKVL